MAEWWSIEVFHGEFRAARWKDAYDSQLIESAIAHGATNWAWIEHRHGVVFEVEFPDDTQWEAFRALPGVRAALDAVPDPVNGLLVYRGRGGGAGATAPRRPRPASGAGAMALPEPEDEPYLVLRDAEPPGLDDPHASSLDDPQGVPLSAALPGAFRALSAAASRAGHAGRGPSCPVP